jgi:hypothetical protein
MLQCDNKNARERERDGEACIMMMKDDGARMMIPKRRSLFVAGHERERREEMVRE